MWRTSRQLSVVWSSYQMTEISTIWRPVVSPTGQSIVGCADLVNRDPAGTRARCQPRRFSVRRLPSALSIRTRKRLDGRPVWMRCAIAQGCGFQVLGLAAVDSADVKRVREIAETEHRCRGAIVFGGTEHLRAAHLNDRVCSRCLCRRGGRRRDRWTRRGSGWSCGNRCGALEASTGAQPKIVPDKNTTAAFHFSGLPFHKTGNAVSAEDRTIGGTARRAAERAARNVAWRPTRIRRVIPRWVGRALRGLQCRAGYTVRSSARY